MIIVSDTSVISALFSINQLDLLRKIYGTVIIPQIVFDELEVLKEFGYDLAPIYNANWLKIVNPTDNTLEKELNVFLDKGESSAIALAKELNPTFLAIDEKKGREVAESLGIPIIGLVGILIVAKKAGIVKMVKPILDELILNAGFRINKSFYSFILKEIEE